MVTLLGGPHACMDPGAALHRRPAGGGGLGAGSPALSGGQARRRKQPPRPADFKLQVIIIGSRGVGKTSLMERFTDDTFCEACKSTVGKAGRGRPRGAPASPDRRSPRPGRLEAGDARGPSGRGRCEHVSTGAPPPPPRPTHQEEERGQAGSVVDTSLCPGWMAGVVPSGEF